MKIIGNFIYLAFINNLLSIYFLYLKVRIGNIYSIFLKILKLLKKKQLIFNWLNQLFKNY
jgi:hypothetical protein